MRTLGAGARESAADSAARRRHCARRPGLQRGPGVRLLEVHELDSADRRRRAASRWSNPGVVQAQLNAAAALRRTVLCARPVHQGPLHDRRDDRQQLLRRSFRRPRQDRRQRRGARRRALRRHPAVARHGRRGRGIRRRRRAAAATARFTPRRARCAERYGRSRFARRYPKIPRRVSGYNLDELLPDNGPNLARALVGSEGTLGGYAGRDAQAGAASATARAGGARLRRRLPGGRPGAVDPGTSSASARGL